jgi:hypothetical protein
MHSIGHIVARFKNTEAPRQQHIRLDNSETDFRYEGTNMASDSDDICLRYVIMETLIQCNGLQQKWIHQPNPFNSSKHISVEKLLASVDATPNLGRAAKAAKRGRSRLLVVT